MALPIEHINETFVAKFLPGEIETYACRTHTHTSHWYNLQKCVCDKNLLLSVSLTHKSYIS